MPIENPVTKAQEHLGTAPISGSTEAAMENGEVTLLDFLVILAERKRFIFSVTAVFAVLMTIISLVLPKRYTATTTLLPPQQNNSLANALSSQLGNLGGMAALAGGSLGLKNPNDMYVAMLKSETVEDAMVRHFGLMQEYHQQLLSGARKKFEDYATVDGNGKDGLIHISIEDGDPKRAAELANGYVDQFRHLTEHLAITEASQRRVFFEQQLEQAKESLAASEEALKETEQKTGVIQLDAQARALIESAAMLRAQISAKEVELQSLRTFATNENPQLLQAQQELDELRAQLAKLGGSENIDGGLMVPQGQVPKAGLEYARKLRDVKYNETIFQILARQFEVAKLDEAKEGSMIQVVDLAIPPDRRSFPKRGILVLIATLAGFLIGIFITLIREGIKRMEESPQYALKAHRLRQSLSFKRTSRS